MKFSYLNLFLLVIISVGCLLRSENPRDKIYPDQIDKSRTLLKKELKLVVNAIADKVQDYPRSTNILIENFDDPSESLLVNVHEFIKNYGSERFKRNLYLESFPNEKYYGIKSFLSAKKTFRTINSPRLTNLNKADYKIVWFNWNPVSLPGIGKLIYALIGRQYQHATVLVIPKDAKIEVTRKGIPRIIQNGSEIPPIDYFSRLTNGEADPDDFYKDRSTFTTNLKAGQISFEYFEIDSEIDKRLKFFESSSSGFRNPYIEYVGREKWDSYQKSKLEFINNIGVDEEKKLQKLLGSFTSMDQTLAKEDIVESIKKFIVGRTISNEAVEAFAEFWFRRGQIHQFEHILTELRIIKYFKRYDIQIAADLKKILDPKHVISYQDFVDSLKTLDTGINPRGMPSEEQFRRLKPMLDKYISGDFDLVYSKFAKKMSDYNKSYNFFRSNCYTYACNAVNNIGGNAPEIKGYWIPHRINSQLIKQNRNIDIYTVKRIKGGVSIRVSDQLAKDKLNRGRNILTIVGLLAIGVPTTVIFREDIADKIQDTYERFNLISDNLETFERELELLIKKYIKISSQLHHLELREIWINEPAN